MKLWTELRQPIKRKSPPRGVALLMVMIGLVLLSVLVTDLSVNETIRYRMAIHHRDALKAEMLARSGLEAARLVTATQAKLQKPLTKIAQMGFPLPDFTVWKLIPMDSSILKGLTDGSIQSMFGLDVSESLQTRDEKNSERNTAISDSVERAENLDDTIAAHFDGEHFQIPKGGFGAFEGSFHVDISDEERKSVSLRNWHNPTASQSQRYSIAQRLFALVAPERYDFLFEEPDAYGNKVTRSDFIANIFDWIDNNTSATNGDDQENDWGRSGGGSEDAPYRSYDVDDVLPRNDFFVSHQELRMVAGMTDAHMKAFGDSISIYGDTKVNILSAEAPVIESLIRICAADNRNPLLQDPFWMETMVQGWFTCKASGGGAFNPTAAMDTPFCQTPDSTGFIKYLEVGGPTLTPFVVDKGKCEENIGESSRTFTIRSTGQAGDVKRTLTLVMRLAGREEERYYYSSVLPVPAGSSGVGGLASGLLGAGEQSDDLDGDALDGDALGREDEVGDTSAQDVEASPEREDESFDEDLR